MVTAGAQTSLHVLTADPSQSGPPKEIQSRRGGVWLAQRCTRRSRGIWAPSYDAVFSRGGRDGKGSSEMSRKQDPIRQSEGGMPRRRLQ